MPNALAAVKSFTAKRCCISGSPPLSVNPPAMTFSPWRYFFNSSAALRDGDRNAVGHRPGVRVVTVKAPPHAAGGPGHDAHAGTINGGAGRERMQEAHVARGERGPDVRFRHVLAEIDAQLERALRLERCLLAAQTSRSCSVEGAVDHVHLLLAREPHEVDGVTRDPDCQVRVLLGVVHGVDEHVAIEHVDVHVKARRAEERIEYRREVRDPILLDPAQALGHEAGRERNAIGRVAIGIFATDAAEAWMPWVSRPCIGLAPGANGSPCRRPSGVLPVDLP